MSFVNNIGRKDEINEIDVGQFLPHKILAERGTFVLFSAILFCIVANKI